MTVLMYHKRFIAPIKAGTKRQTIRRNRKRKIPVGAELSHRYWEGRGYRSPQVEIASGKCKAVFGITVESNRILIGQEGKPYRSGGIFGTAGLDDFARKDGFEDWADLQSYYREQKIKLPFYGVLIQWE
jgi:hypothetical protein